MRRWFQFISNLFPPKTISYFHSIFIILFSRFCCAFHSFYLNNPQHITISKQQPLKLSWISKQLKPFSRSFFFRCAIFFRDQRFFNETILIQMKWPHKCSFARKQIIVCRRPSSQSYIRQMTKQLKHSYHFERSLCVATMERMQFLVQHIF